MFDMQGTLAPGPVPSGWAVRLGGSSEIVPGSGEEEKESVSTGQTRHSRGRCDFLVHFTTRRKAASNS